MSARQVNLCSLLLKEYFGDIVSSVGSALMTMGKSPLRAIKCHSGETIKNCKKALTVLIQHGMVTYGKNDRGLIEYAVEINRILFILRYPKYIYTAKVVFGDFGEQIVQELLKQGLLTCDDIIKKVYKRVESSGEGRTGDKYPRLIYEVLVKMIQERFVGRACEISNETDEALWYPSSLITLDDDTGRKVTEMIPPYTFKLEEEEEDDENPEPSKKRRKKDQESKTEDVYYMVNPEQFHLYMLDIAITDGLKLHYDDEKAARLVQIILRLGQSTAEPWIRETPLVAKSEIKVHCLRQKLFASKDEIDSYLSFLADDSSRFVVLAEERAGDTMYKVNINLIMDKLIQSCLATIVIDRFGTQCGRIFRLLLVKRYLHQKQIEELAMIPAKEAKECTYHLTKNNFVRILQYPKQSDYTPTGSCFLFNINIEEICRTLVERCYKALFNCILRRNHETETHKSLIERKTFIDAVITNLRMQSEQADIEQQIEELNQSFSTHDRELLDKLKQLSDRLELSELQVDETLFLFQAWLSMGLSS